MLNILLLSFALLALLSIVFEEVVHINKAKTTLFLGCLSWLLLFMTAGSAEGQQRVNEHLDDNLLEIAGLWLFLMSTMTFVAYLNAKGMIQVLVHGIFPAQLSQRLLMVLVALFALLLSAICDNVTATLVSLGLVQSYQLEKSVRIKLAALVVFAVNSGGVALITGDVTTLMIFLDGHVSMGQLGMLLIPSASGVVALALMFSSGMPGRVANEPINANFTGVDVAIACIFFATILLTMVFNLAFGIPPVLTFLSGLSVMFLVGRLASTDDDQNRILEYIRQIEFDTLLFFLGILLLVGMLREIHVLTAVAQLYGEINPAIANFLAGATSALLDNVPLTSALLKAGPQLAVPDWLGLTYAVGVGGSLLSIGSAAGIITMSKMEGMTFKAYLQFFPALLVAYSVGYGLTLVMSYHFFTP